MLWDTLKHKVDTFVDQYPTHPQANALHRVALGEGKTVSQYLDSMDIRQVGILRLVVPDAFPRKLRQGQLTAGQNIHGAWRVEVTPETVNL